MKKWKVTVEQNEGEYEGWVTFWAKKVIPVGLCILDVDGYIMEFDEAIVDVIQLEENAETAKVSCES